LRVHFAENGWADYRHWCENDHDVHNRVNQLIEAARRTPFTGLGKPEPLKGNLRGFWSRRVTGEHRLVYTVEGQGDTQCIIVAQCRYHY
jgi:toxin YoeB